jgi:ATP-dependent DNA ligase
VHEAIIHVYHQGRLDALKSKMASAQATYHEPFEDVVIKRSDAPYRPGECRDWRKVKTLTWREANKERWRLFERNG